MCIRDRALIDKDTIYTTESGTQTQAGAAVIGQFVPYKGEYGISKNPESFAIYNYRKYFSDKSRNSIMRLSNDGLTEISMYGMRDYFRDRLAEIDNNFVNRTFTATVVSGGGTSTTVAEVQVDGNDSITPGMTIQGQSGGYVTLVEDAGGGNTRIYYSQLFSPSLIVNINFLYKTRGRIIGGWDTHNKNYVLSMQKYPIQVNSSETPDPNTGEYDSYKTLAFDEDINGWFSFFTFKPTIMFSVLNKFYSVENSSLYEHYDNTTANNRGNFYGTQSPSNITFVFNAQPNIVKNFKTINYEGSNGWEVTNFKSGFEGMDPNPATPPTPAYIQNQDKNYVDPSTLIAIRSYEEGAYDGAGNTGSAASATNPPLLRAGFNRKENKYVANLISGSAARAGEVRFGNQMTGIKGYFATVTIETDNTTQLGGPKELWSAGTEYVISSY